MVTALIWDISKNDHVEIRKKESATPVWTCAHRVAEPQGGKDDSGDFSADVFFFFFFFLFFFLKGRF